MPVHVCVAASAVPLSPGDAVAPAARERVASRVLAARLASQVAGLPVETEDVRQACPECGSQSHGRPYLTGAPAFVSWSHSHGVLAVVAGTLPVAVDVHHATDAAVAASVLGPAFVESDPTDALREWTRWECVVKLGLATLDDIWRLDRTGLESAARVAARTWDRLHPDVVLTVAAQGRWASRRLRQCRFVDATDLFPA